MKYVSIDLETTGLDSENHMILEFGAVIEDTNDIRPIEALPKFHAYIINGENIVGSPYALQMNQAILKKIANREEGHNYILPEELGALFYMFLADNGIKAGYGLRQKIVVAGKNFASFDLKFLNSCKNFTKHIDIHHRVIDPVTSFINWEDDTSPPGFKKCKERAGIEGEIAHTAIEDAIDVIKLLRKSHYDHLEN